MDFLILSDVYLLGGVVVPCTIIFIGGAYMIHFIGENPVFCVTLFFGRAICGGVDQVDDHHPARLHKTGLKTS